jgi:mRNA interferase RelE/StbE
MSEARFEIILDPDAAEEYEKLDNSVLKIVDNAIDRLEERADEIGKVLHNYQGTKLAGCKEIKLKDAGVRIIFKVTDHIVNILQVVYVLTIEHRVKYKVFKVATGRYQKFKIDPAKAITAGTCQAEKKKKKNS